VTEKCRNCGEVLPAEAKYCFTCGQKKLQSKDYTFRKLLKESVFDFFHIDAKLFNSIFPLLFRPGYLTNQWLAGKHMRCFKPFKMFLVVSILYFLLAAINEHYLLKWTVPDQQNNNVNIGWNIIDQPDSTYQSTGSNDSQKEKTPYIFKQGEKFRGLGNAKATEFITRNVSKLIFLLVPVVALLLKLIYNHTNRLYYDHLIFALHIHSFVFLFAVLSGYYLEWWIAIPILLIYIFLALKHVYRQKFLMTLTSNILLILGYAVVILPLFIIITALISLLLI